MLSVCDDSVSVVCDDSLMCVVVVTVFVVEIAYEFEKSRRVSVEGDNVECLFVFV